MITTKEYGVLVGCKTYTAADVEQLLTLVEELAREQPHEPPMPSQSDIVDTWVRRGALAAADKIEALDSVVEHGEAGPEGDGPLTTWAAAYAKHEVSDRCAQVLREIRGYV